MQQRLAPAPPTRTVAAPCVKGGGSVSNCPRQYSSSLASQGSLRRNSNQCLFHPAQNNLGQRCNHCVGENTSIQVCNPCPRHSLPHTSLISRLDQHPCQPEAETSAPAQSPLSSGSRPEKGVHLLLI